MGFLGVSLGVFSVVFVFFLAIVAILFLRVIYIRDYVNSFQPKRKTFSSNLGIWIAFFLLICLSGFIL